MTTLAVMNRVLLTFLLAFLAIDAARATAALQESVRLFVLREAATAAGGTQSRIDVVVGAIDSRLHLAPCRRTEVFVPPGRRLWGRGFAGIRCLDGATWSINVPVTVRIYGPALVATQPLAPGAVVQAEDVRTAEVEWTREAQGVVLGAAQLESRVLSRPVASGQPIPLTALRTAQVVSQGEPVRLVGQGSGFSISADGVAMGSATDGQSVRVRTESGRIVTGTARAGRLVEVQF